MFDLISQRTNSDFFPILSLEAPRARFIGSQPIGLIGVATADLPLREVHRAHRAGNPRENSSRTRPTCRRSLAEQAAMIADGADGRRARTRRIDSDRATDRATARYCCGLCGREWRCSKNRRRAATRRPHRSLSRCQAAEAGLDRPTLDHLRDSNGARESHARRGLVARHARFLPSRLRGGGLVARSYAIAIRNRCATGCCACAWRRSRKVTTPTLRRWRPRPAPTIASLGWNRLQRSYLVAFALRHSVKPH